MQIDFFISYTSLDANWAEWIAWVLEDQGLSVKLQAWDFTPGSNFVIEMHRAAIEASRTIAVLSPDYLRSQFGSPEWAAAFADDPEGFKRRLVPVRIQECQVEGLLKSIVYIDLVGTDDAEAQRRLLRGLSGQRVKPLQRPGFPGAGARSAINQQRPEFPGRDHGPLDSGGMTSSSYIPNVRRAPSDLDKRRLIQRTFDTLIRHFDGSLTVLAKRHQGTDYDLTKIGPTKFTAEIFVDGKSRRCCKIWLGTLLHDNSIAYSENDFGDSFNELLTPTQEGLALVATMNMSTGAEAEGLNVNHLSPEEAAEYLWRRFVSRLT
jgi:hypothetical protein